MHMYHVCLVCLSVGVRVCMRACTYNVHVSIVVYFNYCLYTFVYMRHACTYNVHVSIVVYFNYCLYTFVYMRVLLRELDIFQYIKI